MAGFDRARRGKQELVLVAGYSGIGKSVLVHEIHKPIVQERGLFISGKYEQYKRDIPYLALTRAFRELVRQLLTGSAQSIARWKDKLGGALGAEGSVIVDVIPELALIVGDQPPVLEVDPAAAQSRFRTVFVNFVRALAGPDHPLVVFLDDLQWADSASLKVIELLMTSASDQSLLLVGSYRDNEVGATHPLQIALDELTKANANMTRIALGPLELEHATQLVADTLHCDAARARPLAELLLHKTNGNPFFLIQFFQSLHDEGLVDFDPSNAVWQWSVPEIQQKAHTENVIELMVQKLQRLPLPTQHLLKLAACIGNQFDLRALGVVTQREPAQVAADLWGAVREGQVIPLVGDLTPEARSIVEAGQLAESAAERMRGPGPLSFTFDSSPSVDDAPRDSVRPALSANFDASYRFLHDRVQQAAYSLFSEAERRQTHYKVGQLILRGTPREHLEDHIFDIVNHLNFAAEGLEGAEARRELAELNLIAGRKAKAATAHELAKKHFTLAASLLPADSWEREHDLTSQITIGRAECEYLTGAREAAEALFEELLAHSRTVLAKGHVYSLRTTLYRHATKYPEAIDVAVAGLRLFGLDIPDRVDEPALFGVMQRELGALQGLLGGRDIEELVNLPEMTDPADLAIMDYFEELGLLGMFVSPLLMLIAAFKGIALTIEKGSSRASSPLYSTYGVFLATELKDYESGYRFGRLALEVSRRRGDARAECKSGCWQGICIEHWRAHLGQGVAVLRSSYEIGVRVGDGMFAGFAAFALGMNCLHRGDPLDEALVELQRAISSLADPESRGVDIAFRQLALCLQGLTTGPGEFDSPGWSEAEFVADLAARGHIMTAQQYYVAKLRGLVAFQRWGDAKMLVEKAMAEGDIHSIIRGQFSTAVFVYLHSLVLAWELGRATTDEERALIDEKLAKNQDRISKWAENCPPNFLHQKLLVEASVARARGRDLEAIGLYEGAIDAAQSSGFVQDQALAAELGAELHLERGRRGIARSYLTMAREAYGRWGALGKLKQLDNAHGDLLPALPSASSGQQLGATLDMTAVVRAAQAMSGEIVVERLLGRMMRIILENAGAQVGFFLRDRDGELLIEATGRADEDDILALRSIPFEQCPDLSVGIVKYVARTGERVVLDNAAAEGRFQADPYVVERRPKAVLCVPIITQNKRLGILYLENNLVTGAFTPGRLRVLEVLSSQAAISLENAWLYETLEQKVETRTSELQQKNIELEATMQRLTETRHQLVVQEKLASLGALTAGIAHEIKNPLNFVNNFSDLSVELTEELSELSRRFASQIDAEDRADLEDMLDSLQQNVAKISEHGKRANNIVNGMLLHSRGAAGARAPAELNAVLAESVNLAYHGMRAKDPTFNVGITTEYDPQIGQVEIVDADVSRVFINLVNNACYATRQKQRVLGAAYAPLLSVRTSALGDRVEVRIRDNGTGIPAGIVDKIYNPFFTTKPAGEGTGLGLSIGYDVIVQGHQGSIEVDSTEGEFTEFVVTLPRRALALPRLSGGNAGPRSSDSAS